MSDLSARLRQRLAAARRRITGAAVAHGLLVTAAVVLGLFLLAAGAEAAVWLGVELRTTLFWLIAATLAALAVALVAVPLLRGWGVLPGLDERAVVRRAGLDHPGIDDRLATALDLADGRDSGDDSRLHAAALDALAAEVADVPFERVRAWGPARRALPFAAVPAALLVLALALAPSTMGAAASRLMAPGTYFAPPAPFRLAVTPGDAEATRGATLDVSVEAIGRELPVAATLEVGRADERATETVRLSAETASGAAVFTHTLDVGADLRYRVEADGVRSPWFEITAVDRPLVRGVRVTVVPPGYSGRGARTLPEGVGDATGLVGSTVRVQVAHGGPQPTAGWLAVEWEDGRRQRVGLRVGSDAALGAFRLRGPGRYSVHLKAGDLESTNPAEYSLGTLSDAPPQIALLDGAQDALDAGARRLVFRVTDDFGFRGGALIYRLTREGATGRPRTVRLPVRGRPLDQEVALDWRLPGARPGDVVELYGRVVDNDAGGGKSARTPLVTLRFPSVTDRLDALDAQRDSTTNALDELQEQAEESGERFRRLRDDLRESLDPDWEDRRQVDELLREQSMMREQAQQLREQMNRLGEQIQNSDLQDPTLRQQVEDMQNVLEELDAPDLRDALERLREAMESLDMREMLEQSEEATQSEEQMRRRLERAQELMERLEAAVEMEEIARRAEDLAETEERLAEETEALNEDGERPDEGDDAESGDAEDRESRSEEAERQRIADEQRQAAEQAEALQEQMDALQEALEEMRNAPTESMERMQQQMQQDGGLPQQMEENAEQMEAGETQEAQQGQEQMAQQLRQMAENMRQQSRGMQGQQRQVDQAALRRALEDVLTVSREQEALATSVGRTPSQSPSLVPAARRQGELRDALRTVVDTLRRVAQTVPALGPRIDAKAVDGQREMDLAVERLVARQSGPAAGHQRTAMAHMNDLALLLANLLEQLQNQSPSPGGSGGSGGMPQQMQQMGERQSQINQQIQQMLNESAGERLTQRQGQRLRQLAEQQEALRRQLQRAVQGGGAGLDPNDRSALQQIEAQMEEAAQELRRNRLDTRTAPRQQQIMERLLQAERSVNQRGREEQRQGEAGRTRPPETARPPSPGRPADRVRGDLIRALESGYAPDYQDLIKRYFDRLQARTAG